MCLGGGGCGRGPQPDELLQRGQEVRHLVLAPHPRAAFADELADTGGVLLGQAAGLIEIITPLRRGNAGGGEDVAGAGDGRSQRRLIPQLNREVGEEGAQPFPVITAPSWPSPPRRDRTMLPALGDQILQTRDASR